MKISLKHFIQKAAACTLPVLYLSLTTTSLAQEEPRVSPTDDPGPRGAANAIPPPQASGFVAPKFKGPASAFNSVPGSWTAQGPTSIAGGQVEGMTNKFVCGSIHALLPHPTNPDILYIGSINGGVWKTTNATAANPTWTPLTDTMSSLSIGALAFDSQDPTNNTIWAGIGRYSSFAQIGGSRSGLLKTTDGGATWTAVTGGGLLTGKGISGIVARGNTIVVSVNVADSFTYSNIGIFRSTNGGASFTKISGASGSGLDQGVAYDLASSNSSPNTLFTNCVFPLTAGNQGIYKSTDLGATWALVSPAILNSAITNSTSNCELAFGNSNNLFVGVINSGALAVIYNSPDGGTTWRQMGIPSMPASGAASFTVTDASNTSPIVITTSAPYSFSTSYVEIGGVTGNTAANGTFKYTPTSATTFSLQFSTGNGAYTGGGTATAVISPNPKGFKGPLSGTPEEIAGGQGSIHFSILSHPSNPNLLFIGGDRQDSPFPNAVGANDFSGSLWRGDASVSDSAGAFSQWKHLTHSNAVAAIPGGGTANGSAPHADSRDMAFDANGDLIEVDDGGIFRRTSPLDNTGAWTSMAGNLQITECHSVAYDTVSNVIITGNQDNGTCVQNSTGSLSWTAVSTADGGDVAVSVNPSNASQSIRYSSFQNLGGFRKRIMSSTNTLVAQSFPAITVTGGSALTPQFHTPVQANVVDGNRLIFGADNGIYESSDQGSHVVQLSTFRVESGLTGGHTMIYGGRKNATNNPNLIYAVTGSTLVKRTTAGNSFSNFASPGSTLRSVVADSEDYDHVFVIDNDQVFRSTDGGATFTDITGDIPASAKDFRSLEFIRSGTDWAVVVGTLRGVYAARSGAPADWAPVGALPNAYVWDITYDAADDVLVAAMFGRGAWRFDNASVIAQQPEIVVEQPSGTGLTDGASTVAFGSVGVGGSGQRTFTIRNTGTGPLSVTSVGITGGNSADFGVNTSGMLTSIPAAGSTQFTVSFNPSVLGSRSTTLQVASDDTDEAIFDIALAGDGTNTPVTNPVSFTVGGTPGSATTGSAATDGSGAADGTQFDALQRSGFLAENGTLAFLGYLKTGVGGVDATNFMGYWKQDLGSSTLTRLARMGENAPETGATAAKFNILPLIPGINDAGQVTLFASLLQSGLSTPATTADNDVGLWSELGGTGFQILIREDDVIPGLAGSPKVDSLGWGCFATAKTGVSTGEAAFVVGMKGSSTETALLRASVTGPDITAVGIVARENTAAPGAGENFGGLNNTITRSVRMDALGNLCFAAYLPTSGKTGIWYQDQATKTVRKTVLTGDAAPSTTTTFAQLDLPNMGGEGVFAFRAVLNQTGDNADNSKNDGIWKYIPDIQTILNVIRRGDSNTNRPGLFGSAYTTTYPNIKAGNIYNGWLTNSSFGAWLGWVDLGGDGISPFAYDGNFTATTDTFGIYTDVGGPIKLLIASGDDAPGIAGSKFFFIDHPVCGGAQQVAFIGTVTGGGTTATNNKGIWRTGSQGAPPQLVLRTGDGMSVTINGVASTKTILDLDIPGSGYADHIWETPVMDSTGRLLVFVTFTDGTTTQVIVP